MITEQIDEFGESYLRLALEINKHIDGYVDAYYGPEQIKKEVESVGALPPKQLSEDHHRLVDLLPTEEPKRHKYLLALVDAMGFMIRKLNGEEFDYLEEVEGLFGIKPELVPENVFLEVHKSMDEHYPGSGSLAERIEKRKQELRIPAVDIPKAIDLILNEIRNRTEKLFPLNFGESFDIGYVNDKPWWAYNHYLGDYKSLIEINLDIDFGPRLLTNLLTHEAYPGHHTEQQFKERCLLEEKSYFEESCLLLFTPSTIVTEGIAETALEIISPDMEIYTWMAEELVPALNLTESTAEEFYNKHKVGQKLRYCTANAAIMYHSGTISEEEAIDYIQTYNLVNEKLAKQSFRMATDPLYKTYIFTYTEGYKLIDQACQGKSKLPLFKRLLTEQMLPDDL